MNEEDLSQSTFNPLNEENTTSEELPNLQKDLNKFKNVKDLNVVAGDITIHNLNVILKIAQIL